MRRIRIEGIASRRGLGCRPLRARQVGGTIMVMLLLSGLAAGSVLANGINPIISALSPAAGNASGF
jgi:preprotein translocase subunit SecY